MASGKSPVMKTTEVAQRMWGMRSTETKILGQDFKEE